MACVSYSQLAGSLYEARAGTVPAIVFTGAVDSADEPGTAAASVWVVLLSA